MGGVRGPLLAVAVLGKGLDRGDSHRLPHNFCDNLDVCKGAQSFSCDGHPVTMNSRRTTGVGYVSRANVSRLYYERNLMRSRRSRTLNGPALRRPGVACPGIWLPHVS